MNAASEEQTGRYRHIKLVYVGQSSQLWKARDDRDGRIVAVKRLLPSVAGDRSHLALLKKEVQVAAALDGSPWGVQIYETGKEAGLPFVVMEWFPAPSVGQLLKLGYEVYAPLLPTLIPLLFEPLIPLHEAGWVHRDIKPDNYLFSPELGLKLIDFAIAVKKGEGKLSRIFVKSGPAQGTATYMSPEQIENKGVDGRSDLYNLGCTILELVSDAAPFSGSSLKELLQKHLTGGSPSATAKNRNVTPQFDAFLKSLLARKPSDRPATAREALAILKRTPLFIRPPQSGDKVR